MNTEKFPEIQKKSQEFTNIIIVAKKFLRNTNKFSFFPQPLQSCSAVQCSENPLRHGRSPWHSSLAKTPPTLTTWKLLVIPFRKYKNPVDHLASWHEMKWARPIPPCSLNIITVSPFWLLRFWICTYCVHGDTTFDYCSVGGLSKLGLVHRGVVQQWVDMTTCI